MDFERIPKPLGRRLIYCQQTCITTLAMRNMVRPFAAGRSLLEQACPMDEVLHELSAQLAEFKELKKQRGPRITAAA